MSYSNAVRVLWKGVRIARGAHLHIRRTHHSDPSAAARNNAQLQILASAGGWPLGAGTAGGVGDPSLERIATSLAPLFLAAGGHQTPNNQNLNMNQNRTSPTAAEQQLSVARLAAAAGLHGLLRVAATEDTWMITRLVYDSLTCFLACFLV